MAVAGRVFDQIPEAGVPARTVHDAVALGVYVAVRAAGATAGGASRSGHERNSGAAIALRPVAAEAFMR